MRILITGMPKTGKTTFSNHFTVPTMHTDDLIHLSWDDQAVSAASWLHTKPPWVIEGCMVIRALRHWLNYNHGELPFDHLIYLSTPVQPLNPRQMQMAKGLTTVWQQIKPIIMQRMEVR